jgi:hypothetical protein
MSAIDAVADYLADKQSLLILDNSELRARPRGASSGTAERGACV